MQQMYRFVSYNPAQFVPACWHGDGLALSYSFFRS